MIVRFLALALAALLPAGQAAFARSPAARAPAAPAATGWPQDGTDLAGDPAIRFGTLPNGMHYALRHNVTPPGAASIRLRIDAGSLAETDAQRGLAHFVEHMVLNGTTNVPEGEFMRRLERHGLRMGADTNAITDWTQTVFKLDLPRNDADSIDTALFLLREIAGEATFAPAAIDAERRIIQAEGRARAGPQLNIIEDELGFNMPGQPIGRRMPIGLPEVIASAGQADLAAFYRAYYRPERATLIAVGDFDVDEMERKLRARFGDWAGRGPAGPDPVAGTPALRPVEARVHVETGVPVRVSLSWVRPIDRRPDSAARRADTYVDQLVIRILNRRLERIAAAGGVPPFAAGLSVRAAIANSADTTVLLAVAQPGRWQAALAALETERRRLVEDGISQEEITREVDFMDQRINGEVIGAATQPSATLADGLVSAVNLGLVYTSNEDDYLLFAEARRDMTRRRVARAARAMLGGDPLLYMTAPAPVADGEATLLAAWRAAHGARVATAAVPVARVWPYTEFGTPGVVRERHNLPAPIAATMVHFANGVRLTVRHNESDDDLIMIGVRAGNGRLDEPSGASLQNWEISASVIGGGFGRISLEDADDGLSQRPSATRATIQDDAFLFTANTRSAELPLQLQILAAQVSDPGWRPGGWERLRGLSASLLDTLDTTPLGVFGRDADALLHNGDPRWAMPSRERLAATTIGDLRALLEGPLKHGPLEIIMVGDIDIETAIRETARTFGALPVREETPRPAATATFPSPGAEPVRLTHGGRADQALAAIAWPAGDYYADLHRARTLELLADVFTLRLLQEIRERQGLSYAPQADYQGSRTFPGYGMLISAIDAEPAALPGFLRDARTIAADLRDRPVEADELQRARQPRLGVIQRDRSGNSWWLDRLARIQQDPRVANDILTELDDYQAITPADLQRAAREVLLPGRAWSVVVVPRAAPAAP